MALKDTLKELLGKNRIKLTFEKFDELPDTDDFKIIKEDATLLEARFSGLERKVRMGIMDNRDERIERAQITSGLLELIKMIPDEGAASKIKILFLASNPMDSGRLRLDVELRDIREGLRRSKYRDRYELVDATAVRSRDLLRALLDEEPVIVHFSGHGVDGQSPSNSQNSLSWEDEDDVAQGYAGGIALEDNQGNTKIVRADTLGSVFANFDMINCVLLNACYSASQADELIKHIPYVIGMNTAVPDRAAIEFATSFYDTLGASSDLDIERAFSVAKSSLNLFASESAYIPQIKKKD